MGRGQRSIGCKIVLDIEDGLHSPETRRHAQLIEMETRLDRQLAGLTERLEECVAALECPWWRRLLSAGFKAGKE